MLVKFAKECFHSDNAESQIDKMFPVSCEPRSCVLVLLVARAVSHVLDYHVLSHFTHCGYLDFFLSRTRAGRITVSMAPFHLSLSQ